MKKFKILLVEDDKFISRAYTDGLGRAGFEVNTALDGAEALRKVRSDTPDIVLLDLVIPVKDGFEVLEELKLDKKLSKIPVVVLSNLGQQSDIKRAKELGVEDYLIKSDLSMREVISKIKFYLAKDKS